MKEGYEDNGLLKTIMGSYDERLPFEVTFEDGCYHVVLSLVKPQDPFFDMLADVLDAGTGVNQQVEFDFKTNFSMDEIFAKDAPPIHEFLMKGMAANFTFCTWGGFKYFFRDMFVAMKENKDEARVKMANMVLPLVPLFFFKATGHLKTNLDP
jgi:hypothetical protein